MKKYKKNANLQLEFKTICWINKSYRKRGFETREELAYCLESFPNRKIGYERCIKKEDDKCKYTCKYCRSKPLRKKYYNFWYIGK
jgi:hypothetical protein